MSSARPTAGEWSPSALDRATCWILATIEGQDVYLADITCEHEEGCFEHDPEARWANACLMAAAKDMQSALGSIIRALREVDDTEALMKCRRECVDIAREAIKNSRPR
jgi:hypothetical protein